MSSKLPGFYFFPADWIRDTRLLSLPARGFYTDLLCLMWDSPRRGFLLQANTQPFSIEQLASYTGCSPETASLLLNELFSSGTIDKNQRKIPYNRRMVREEKMRIGNRLRKGQQRLRASNINKTVTHDVTHDVTAMSQLRARAPTLPYPTPPPTSSSATPSRPRAHSPPPAPVDDDDGTKTPAAEKAIRSALEVVYGAEATRQAAAALTASGSSWSDLKSLLDRDTRGEIRNPPGYLVSKARGVRPGSASVKPPDPPAPNWGITIDSHAVVFDPACPVCSGSGVKIVLADGGKVQCSDCARIVSRDELVVQNAQTS